MSFVEVLRRVRYLVFRDRYTADLEEEMRLHRDLRASRMVDPGTTLSESNRAAARSRFGNQL